MSLTYIDPMKHLVRETAAAKIFRRHLKFPDILTFWSAETGQWILAYWIDKRRKIVEELEDLGPVFEYLTPDLLRSITICWRPVDWKAKKRRLLSKEADRIRKETDELIEDQQRWNWAEKQLRSHGRNPIPFAFSTPIKGGEVL